MTPQEKQAILAKIQELTIARLRALLTLNPTPEHKNRDAYFSPSQWDVDLERKIRHTLVTTAAWSMPSDTKMKIDLTYIIKTMGGSAIGGGGGALGGT